MKPSEFWESTPKEIFDFIKATEKSKARWAHTQATLNGLMFGSVLSTTFGKNKPFPTFEQCFKGLLDQEKKEITEQRPLTEEERHKQQEMALQARIAKGKQAILQRKAGLAIKAKVEKMKERKQDGGG